MKKCRNFLFSAHIESMRIKDTQIGEVY